MHKCNALKFTLFLYTLISSTGALAEASCSNPSAHEAFSLLLVDRSDPPKDAASIAQTIDVVKNMIVPGERLLVEAVTDRATNTRIIFDLVRPKSSVWEPALKIRAKEKHFHTCLDQLENNLSNHTENYKTTALMETLHYAAEILQKNPAQPRRLFIHSDMVQNSETISFYGKKPIEVDKTLKKIEDARLLPDLHGVDVFIAGVGGSLSDQHSLTIEELWKKYFVKSKANLKSYGPILVTP